MDKDWLIERINEEAEWCFEKDFESLTTDDNGANQLFSKVKQTEERSAFREKCLSCKKRKVEQDHFHKLE